MTLFGDPHKKKCPKIPLQQTPTHWEPTKPPTAADGEMRLIRRLGFNLGTIMRHLRESEGVEWKPRLINISPGESV